MNPCLREDTFDGRRSTGQGYPVRCKLLFTVLKGQVREEMTIDIRKKPDSIAAVTVIAAFLLTAGIRAYGAQTVDPEQASAMKPAQIMEEALSEAGKSLDEQTHVIAEQVTREAMDPEGKDKFITASGKVLRRTDGKWIFPEEGSASDDEVTIVFTGDIIFDTRQNPWSSIAYSEGIEACFDDETWDTLTGADFLVVNNEFPYTDGGSPTPGKTFTFRCPPETASWIGEMGTDIAALANNHIYDYGWEGAMDTFDTLDEEGIPYIGAGRDLDDAEQTAYCIANGVTIAILNATEIERYENPDTKGAGEDSPGVFRCLDDSRLCEKISEAKEKADLCIAFVHWGTEKMPSADWSQMSKAQDLADAGADLIVGAHPHVLQNIEYVDGVPVFYSLGNYFFGAAARDTGVLRVTIDTGEPDPEEIDAEGSDGEGSGSEGPDGDKPFISSLQFIPMLQYRGVSTVDGWEKERVLDEMRAVSPGVYIDEDGFFTEE